MIVRLLALLSLSLSLSLSRIIRSSESTPRSSGRQSYCDGDPSLLAPVIPVNGTELLGVIVSYAPGTNAAIGLGLVIQPPAISAMRRVAKVQRGTG
jgi:hypothetical protein